MAYFAKIFKISLGRRYSILKEADLELNITASVIPWVIEIFFFVWGDLFNSCAFKIWLNRPNIDST